MNDEKMREDFEAWLSSIEECDFELCEDGLYSNWNTQRDWLTWCAAIDSMQPEITKLRLEVCELEEQLANLRYEARG